MPRTTSVLAVAAALAAHTGEPLYRAFNRNTLAALAADARPVFASDDDDTSNAPADETTSERNERLRRLASAHRASRCAARNRNAPTQPLCATTRDVLRNNSKRTLFI